MQNKINKNEKATNNKKKTLKEEQNTDKIAYTFGNKKSHIIASHSF